MSTDIIFRYADISAFGPNVTTRRSVSVSFPFATVPEPATRFTVEVEAFMFHVAPAATVRSNAPLRACALYSAWISPSESRRGYTATSSTMPPFAMYSPVPCPCPSVMM